MNALLSAVDEVKSGTKIVNNTRPSIIKDDDYVRSVEETIESQGTTVCLQFCSLSVCEVAGAMMLDDMVSDAVSW